MKKTTKIFLMLLIIFISLFIIVFTFLINNKKENLDNNEYVLKKLVETNTKIGQNSKIIKADNIVFLETGEKYLKVYTGNGENITPKEIDNIKLQSIYEIKENDKFYGYIVNDETNGYYIDNKGKIIFKLESNYNYALENYIYSYTNEVCSTSVFDGFESKNSCTIIYDLKDNLLIDGRIEKYENPRIIYNKNNMTLFAMTKNKKEGVVNKDNKIVIDFEYNVINYMENKNIIIAKKGSNYNLIDIYDLEGNLLKQLNTEDIEIIKENKYRYNSTFEEYSIYLNDTIYLIDENYEFKKYDDIYYQINFMEGYHKKFYITDSIYIKDNNGIYTVHNLKGEKIINDEFKFVGNANQNGFEQIGVPNGYITLCKNKDRTNCGAIDFDGNIILSFENEINNYKEEYSENGVPYLTTFNGFKKEKQYFDIENGKITQKISCDNLNFTINKYFKNTIYVQDETVTFENGGNKIIDYNCNNLSDAKYHNIYEYDNFIVAQNADWDTYDVYDTNGKMINYKNLDDGKLYNLLGYGDGKLYFGYKKNIYVLIEK